MKLLIAGAAIASTCAWLTPAGAFAQDSAPAFAALPLAQAEGMSVTISPDVAIARARTGEAQALFDQARAAIGPALTANYALSPQAANNGQTILQQFTTVGAQFTLGDVLAYSPAAAQANANLRAAQFALADAERAERIAVIRLYFSALQAHALTGVRAQGLKWGLAQARAAQLRFAAGDAPHLDVVRAAVAVARAQAEAVTARAEEDNAFAALATETGAQESNLGALASVPVPDSAAPEVTAAVEDALARRPEVSVAQANVLAEEHAVATARTGTLPIVTIGGGYTSGIDSGFAVSGPSANALVTFPLGGASRYRVVAEEARLDEARWQLTKVRRDLTTEVSAAVRTYAAENAVVGSAQRALQAALTELKSTHLAYRNGAGSSLDVEIARTTYVQAQLNAIAAIYARAQAAATLHLLMGR